jgi:hypothetical protein
MKRAVSISIGSSKRNKAVEVTLLGEKISIERIGTDGDMEAAALKYKELDGTLDAFGVGGGDLGAMVDGKWYPFYSVLPMVRYVKKTPLVDGTGLKNTLENKAPAFVNQKLGDYINAHGGPKVLMPAGVDRWGLAEAFVNGGFEVVFGDMMFGLGIPRAMYSLKQLKTVAALLMPIAGRLPYSWIYPLGEQQEKRTPKWGKYYEQATIIAGDFHLIRRFMPEKLDGKVIVTNTTTAENVEELRKAGVKYLVTTTPVMEGRSFGTNMMEAALVAVAGKGRTLTWPELSEMIGKLGFEPQLQELN